MNKGEEGKTMTRPGLYANQPTEQEYVVRHILKRLFYYMKKQAIEYMDFDRKDNAIYLLNACKLPKHVPTSYVESGRAGYFLQLKKYSIYRCKDLAK